MKEFNVVIPSRLDSKRLPRKALAMIHGKPLIEWVHQRAIESNAQSVLIATDSEEIACSNIPGQYNTLDADDFPPDLDLDLYLMFFFNVLSDKLGLPAAPPNILPNAAIPAP